MLGELQQVYQFAAVLYQQVQNAKANKYQCQRLAQRVKLVVDMIQNLQQEYSNVKYVPALKALCKSLDYCHKFVSQFEHKDWMRRVFRAGNDQAEFEAINRDLNEAVQMLNLGINTQQVFDHEQDKADQAADQAAILQQQQAIYVAVNANHQEQMNAQQDLREIIVKQFKSVHFEYAQPVALPDSLMLNFRHAGADGARYFSEKVKPFFDAMPK